ncbi:glycine betaine ABC transporter substrate-binding protein [Vibrio sp. CB1-14]|uniref:Glycine betaine ABC transporter substrate-binding protein n=1 Tax=Vibrio chaetopteri TaxID=3016528 RepID=A0AAU8BL00_9VIBR
MSSKLILFLRHPVMLMLAAVFLWMLYPPVVNHLIDLSNVFYVAAVAHSFAAICIILFTVFLFFGKSRVGLSDIYNRSNISKLLVPTLCSGFLICTNHLLLYAALSTSKEFDVIAILIFETWPILFFLIDTALRRDKRKVTISDYIFPATAFGGFIVLTAPNMDLADWILLDSPMLQTIGFALAGGIAMAVNCYFRMKCMDAWSEISSCQKLRLSSFKRGLLTEAGVRSIAAPLLIIALMFSGEEVPDPDPINLLLLSFVGVVILAVGSLIYDLSVYKADNASISALWYLMPVGAVIILAIMQGRLLNQYEAVASVLIVASNVFLVLKYPLKSSLLILFASVCFIGVWILFAPAASIDNYYDLLAVSTVFFVLLATFALERTTALNRERENLLGEFSEYAMRIVERLNNDKNVTTTQPFPSELKQYTYTNLFSFLRAFKSSKELRLMQKRTQTLKYKLLSYTQENSETRDDLLGLFKVGDKLQTMESDRLPTEEFVILFLLGGTNVIFSLLFRPETLSSSLFALIVGTSMIYLLLIIFERDKFTTLRPDHAIMCTNLVRYVQGKLSFGVDDKRSSELESIISSLIKEKSIAGANKQGGYWIFSIFTFLIGGFGYAFLYTSLEQTRSIEASPLVLANNPASKTKVNIALLDWPSAQIKGHILTKIINQHTELDASLRSVSNQQAFQEMDLDKGLVDIHPEFWVENNPNLVRRYVKAFGSVSLGGESTNGSQGLCYTDYGHQSSPRLTMDNLNAPEMIARFDLTGDGKGDIWVGADSWSSTEIEQRRLSAYGLDTSYNYHIFDSEVFQMLHSRNNQNEVPSLFFCYYPDAVFVDQHVHFIESKPHNSALWQDIVVQREQIEPNRGTSWPRSTIQIAYRSDLVKEQAALEVLMNNFVISNKSLVKMLAEVQEGGRVDTVAEKWIEKNQDTVLEWLTGFKLLSDSN